MQTTTHPISDAAKSLIEAIKSCKGQYVSCQFTSNVKPAAAHKSKVLTKTTAGVFRSGIDYGALQSVKGAIEAGERGEVEGLPWGEWALFPWLIVHGGVEYLRLYPVPDQKMTVSYCADGIYVDKAVFQQYLTPSQCAEKEAPACITKKLAEVQFVGCWEAAPTEDQEACEACQ